MLQRFIRSRQSSAHSVLQHNALDSTEASHLIRTKPAGVLVFLLLVATTSGVLYLYQQSGKNASATVGTDTQMISDENTVSQEDLLQKAAEGIDAAQTNEGPEESNQTSTIKVESKVVNGVADTRVEVNGEEVPTDPNTSQTHTSIQNGSGGTTQITTHNSQSNNGGFNFNSNTSTSTSFSHSVNNSSTVGGN